MALRELQHLTITGPNHTHVVRNVLNVDFPIVSAPAKTYF